jgi:hypothetical protein
MVSCSADGAGYCTNLTWAHSERVLQRACKIVEAGLPRACGLASYLAQLVIRRRCCGMWCRRSPCDRGHGPHQTNPGHQTARPVQPGGPVGVAGGAGKIGRGQRDEVRPAANPRAWPRMSWPHGSLRHKRSSHHRQHPASPASRQDGQAGEDGHAEIRPPALRRECGWRQLLPLRLVHPAKL